MRKIFNWSHFIIATTIFIGLMVVGSLYDYEISFLLYDGSDNLITDIVASIGFFPTVLCAFAGGIMIFNSNTHRYGFVTFVKSFILFGCSVFAFYYLYDEYTENSEFLPGLVIAAALLIVFGVFIYIRTKKYEDKNKLVLFGLFLVSLSCAQILVNLACKYIFLRPRMYFIFAGGCGYQNWYDVDREAIRTLILSGVDDSNFASFPSGHATCSMAATSLWTICAFSDKYKGKELLFYILGLIYCLFVCFTRIWCGAHFLTDVTVGIYISFYTSFICYLVYLRKFREKS